MKVLASIRHGLSLRQMWASTACVAVVLLGVAIARQGALASLIADGGLQASMAAERAGFYARDIEEARPDWPEGWTDRRGYEAAFIEWAPSLNPFEACANYTISMDTPEGYLGHMAKVCALPFGKPLASGVHEWFCQPGARQWSRDRTESDKQVAQTCEWMRAYASGKKVGPPMFIAAR